ncbi:MAG: glycoside hydrolase domain-containing protein [Planctomycetota bacterium]|jgi:hypothetical protein
MNRSLIPQLLLIAALLLGIGGRNCPAGEPVLGPGSPARKHVTWRTPLVRVKGGGLEEARSRKNLAMAEVHTSAPAESWERPEFDDRNWTQSVLPAPPYDARDGRVRMKGIYGQAGGRSMVPAIAVVNLRVRFRVVRPAAMDLVLRYRGGAAVYVNGTEVARSHLPEGKLTAETMAEDYDPKAFEGRPGKSIPYGTSSPAKYAANLKLRVRELRAKIAPGILKPGTNVLAVAIHRAPYHGSDIAKSARRTYKGYMWSTCGLVELRLDGPGAVPSVAQSKGVAFTVAGVAAGNGHRACADLLEPQRPLEIFGARNGVFTGKVLASSAGPITGLKASVGSLKHSGGKGALPADAVEILYDHGEALLSEAPAKVAPAEKGAGASTAVWVKVRVPADAAPGVYEGQLSVSAGAGRKIPVKLSVADWKLPDPGDWETVQGFLQSPESVALRYKVPLWSDEHFARMEESFRLIGEAGGKEITIYLAGRSCLGNEQTMVRWIKKPGSGSGVRGSGQGVQGRSGTGNPEPRTRNPGPYTHDFSVVDRYLDLALKHVKPRVTVLYAWEKYMGGAGRFGYMAKDRAHKTVPVKVTLLDPTSGKTSLADGPYMSGPKFDAAAAAAFWKPVCEGVLERLRKRGIEKTAVLGMVGDGKPSPEAVALFKKLMPGVSWSENGHVNRLGGDFHGAKITYSTSVYINSPPAPSAKRLYGWKNMVTLFPRGGPCLRGRLSVWSPPLQHRAATELCLMAGLSGVGRFGVDFWDCVGDEKKWDEYPRSPAKSISGRFPESDEAQLCIDHSMRYVLAPGPKGAAPTARYENLREGVQEAQARVFIERALLEKKVNGKLGARAQAVLDERAQLMRAGFLVYGWDDAGTALGSVHAGRLYEAAAEVAKASGH